MDKIRLTEEDLRNIVTEAVKKIIKESEVDEGLWNAIKGASKKVSSDAKGVANNIGNKISNAAPKVGNYINKGIEKARNYYNDVKQAGIDASNNGEIQNAINVINKMIEKQLVNPKAANMVISSMKKYIK